MNNAHLSLPIYLLFFSVILGTHCSGQSNTSESSKVDKINELISTYANYGEFNGAILVAEKGKILYQKGFGLANMEWNIPNQTDTKFRVGSITKQFTAMIIVQLAAENKLDLQLPISTYLPEYPKENADRITIHHLLTHTSGTPNSYESPKPKVDNPNMIIPDNYTPKDLVHVFSALPLDFTPGEKFSYSNSGYTVLGFIIETVTKKPYHQVLQERIFTPLNMKNTGFEKHRPLIKNRASGYFQNWGTYYNANYIDVSSVYAAGALYSTVEDLYRWDQALYTEKILPQKYLDLIFTQHAPDPDYGGHYGYGWSIKNKVLGSSMDNILTIGHDGVIDGFCALFTRVPSNKISIIILSNIRRAPLNAMTKGIMGILYDKPYDFPKKSLAYSLLEIIDEEGIQKGLEQYEAIKEDSKYYLSENELNIVSYKLLQSDRAKAAAAVLKLGIEAYPNAFNLYDSHGEVLLTLGDTLQSIENYKKSLVLNPENENGIQMLKTIGVEIDQANLYLLKTEDTWGKEIFTFPIHFAKDINYEGVEEAHFPKGWREVESPEFWSYAFAWNINFTTKLTTTELETNLQRYFDGLMDGVNKKKDLVLPKTVAKFQNNEDAEKLSKFTGTVKVHDAFVTQRTMTLHVMVEAQYCEEEKKSIIVFKFSPKNFGNEIWQTLKAIELRENVCEGYK